MKLDKKQILRKTYALSQKKKKKHIQVSRVFSPTKKVSRVYTYESINYWLSIFFSFFQKMCIIIYDLISIFF